MIITFFNFSFSSTIVFLIQSFISSNHCLKKKKNHLILYRFLNFIIYIFLNSIVSFCSTFHLLPPFLFHLNFYINFLLFHFHPSPLFLPSCPQQNRSILSLSLSPQFCFSIGGIFFFFWFFVFVFFFFQPLIFRIPVVRCLIMKS